MSLFVNIVGTDVPVPQNLFNRTVDIPWDVDKNHHVYLCMNIVWVGSHIPTAVYKYVS